MRLVSCFDIYFPLWTKLKLTLWVSRGVTLDLSGRVDHVSRIRQTDTVATAIGLHDGAGAVVGFLPRPVALEFQQHLDPTRHHHARRLHATYRQIVAGGG